MVDRDTAIELREWSDSYRTEGVTKNVDRNDERGEFLVGGLEFGHDFRDCRCEHGRGQGPAVDHVMLATCTRWKKIEGSLALRR